MPQPGPAGKLAGCESSDAALQGDRALAALRQPAEPQPAALDLAVRWAVLFDAPPLPRLVNRVARHPAVANWA